jgi:VWFA-related protein
VQAHRHSVTEEFARLFDDLPKRSGRRQTKVGAMKCGTLASPASDTESPMMQTFVALLIGVAAVTPRVAQETVATQTAAGSIEIDTVFVDRAGNPVRDIRRDEIEVWIAGYRVPLDKFMQVTPDDALRSRRSIVLLLDDITLDPALFPRVRQAGRQMVARMNPGDQMAIVSLSGETTGSTDDSVTLLRALDRFTPRASGYMRPDDLGAHVLRTIETLSTQLAEAGARRRTIVGLGSGWLFDTPLPPPINGRDLRPEWVAAMRAIAAANVTFYVIDAGGVGRTRFPGGDAGFARETGGFAFLNTNDVNAAADQIMTEASTYYILGVRSRFASSGQG